MVYISYADRTSVRRQIVSLALKHHVQRCDSPTELFSSLACDIYLQTQGVQVSQSQDQLQE